MPSLSLRRFAAAALLSAISLPALAADLPKPAFPNQTQAPPPASPSQIKVEVVAHGLDHPWSVAFLPGGDMLVTERKGQLRLVRLDGTISDPLAGVPAVRAVGTKGLHDVVLDPGFARNRLVWLTYLADNPAHADRTARAWANWLRQPDREADKVGFETIAHARLSDDGRRLEDLKVVLAAPSMGARRLAFARDGKLFVGADTPAAGDLKSGDEPQKLGNLYGKVLRLNRDGSAPRDNPFVNTPGARPEIWALGFRDPEGVALDPRSGALWTVENSQAGGDELNRVERGGNYGFPTISYGRDAGGVPLGAGLTEAPGLRQPVYFWNTGKPFSLSGLAIHSGKGAPAWRGDVFAGGLAGKTLFHLKLKNGRVVSEEPLLAERGKRIRDVREGPDGALWVLTDETDGELLRITPAA
jgi:glucose/arabinose dehydrogenase